MSYQLGDITLPRPFKIDRQAVETSVSHRTLDGTTKKDISGRKWRYTLYFEYLTQAQVNNILSEYNLQIARNFSVSDGSLVIASIPVHIEIVSRDYGTPGSEYRENIIIGLEEVS